MVVYCKLTGVRYSRDELNVSQLLLILIKLFLELPNTPIDIFQNNDCKKICMKRAKKYLCLEVQKYVKNNVNFRNDFKNRFKLTPKQISQLLKHKCKKISIFSAVLIYFLVQRILENNGQNILLQKNNELNLDLNSRSGYYFMQNTYIFILNIIASVEPNNIYNINALAANYIVDSFNCIDNVNGTIQNWYNNYNNNVNFICPIF